MIGSPCALHPWHTSGDFFSLPVPLMTVVLPLFLVAASIALVMTVVISIVVMALAAGDEVGEDTVGCMFYWCYV